MGHVEVQYILSFSFKYGQTIQSKYYSLSILWVAEMDGILKLLPFQDSDIHLLQVSTLSAPFQRITLFLSGLSPFCHFKLAFVAPCLLVSQPSPTFCSQLQPACFVLFCFVFFVFVLHIPDF